MELSEKEKLAFDSVAIFALFVSVNMDTLEAFQSKVSGHTRRKISSVQIAFACVGHCRKDYKEDRGARRIKLKSVKRVV